MFELLEFLWMAIQLIIGFNLVFPLILHLFYSLKNQGTIDKTIPQIKPDYAIIITAFKYTNTLPSAVASVLKLNYSNFHVYVVADNCDISNLHFEDEKVSLLRPEEVLAGNVRSHFYAIDRFKRKHDIITIIDSDNIVDSDYLKQLNIYFGLGFKAVQGCRAAKNLDTNYACLDAARDIYYHYYDCQLLFKSGSSSTLSGSGMAFDADLYRLCLESKDINGAGFDKVLQSLIVSRDERIAYASGAIVYDEKTSKPEELVNQRSRWINTWFTYFSLGFGLIAKGIRKGSLNQFLFGIVLLRPPLFLFLLVAILMMGLNLFYSPVSSLIWLVAFFLFSAGFIKALTASDTDKRIYKSLKGIPKFMFYQLISLTKARNANERSVSTRHFHT